MKKILIVSTVAVTIRGFYSAFPAYFRKLGYRVDGMAYGITSDEGCKKAFDNLWDIDWTRSPLNFFNIIRAIKKVRSIVEREQYDLVHVCTPIAAFVTRFALRRMRSRGDVKIVYTAHGFHFYKEGSWIRNTVFLSLEKLAGQWTDFLMVVNREDEQAVSDHGIVVRNAMRYVPGCGIDIQRFNIAAIPESDIDGLYRELGLLRGTPLFLTITDLIPRKRPWDIIEAFARLRRTDACLLVAGGGRLMDNMQALARKLNVEKRVRFLGMRHDIPVLIRASKATVVASRQEGLSQCVQESLALGVPVIATNIRGVRDLLGGGNGILVEVGDVDGFAQSMAWVLDNPQEAKALGERGPHVISSCDLRIVLGIHEEVYASVLAPANRSSLEVTKEGSMHQYVPEVR